MQSAINYLTQRQRDFVHTLLILFFSVILVFDLFFIPGHGVTFDGPTHITNIALFYRGLSEGEFRVEWGDGFASFGLPMPLMVQQTTSYLGAYINFLTKDVVLSYNIVTLIGTFLSSVFFYLFLRIYFSPLPALVGAIAFNFAPYRIVNIYSRGALPEYFAGVFIPLILISLRYLIHKQRPFAILLLAFSVAGLIYTHPFLFIVSLFLLVPYGLFEWLASDNKVKTALAAVISVALGIGISATYLLPLFDEIKYFFYSQNETNLKENQFLNLDNFTNLSWNYWGHEATRGYTISLGIIETAVVFITLMYLLYLFQSAQKKQLAKLLTNCRARLVTVSLVCIPVLIFFCLEISKPLYQAIPLLAGIQFPWRMFTVLIFIPPIFIAFLISKLPKHAFLVSLIVLVIFAIARFPQIYTKNNIIYPQSNYFYTTDNLHGTFLNTIWSQAAENYPKVTDKFGILEGEGTVLKKEIKNSERTYIIDAKTPMRLIDYTFFFPGWLVFLDGDEQVPIEFQDIKYRGLITYRIPQGVHTVRLKFIDTRIRKYGYVATAASILAIVGIYMVERRFKILLKPSF